MALKKLGRLLWADVANTSSCYRFHILSANFQHEAAQPLASNNYSHMSIISHRTRGCSTMDVGELNTRRGKASPNSDQDSPLHAEICRVLNITTHACMFFRVHFLYIATAVTVNSLVDLWIKNKSLCSLYSNSTKSLHIICLSMDKSRCHGSEIV